MRLHRRHNVCKILNRYGILLLNEKVYSFFDIPLHDAEGIIIEFVAVHWNNPIPSHIDLEKDYKEELFHLAWKLEEMIRELTCMDQNAKKRK